jgi:dihydrodipicolinate synthase/N-acetylneuraminate lyase
VNSQVQKKRLGLIKYLFPKGVPQLWCPPLTHYTDSGEIDFVRMEKHRRIISRWIKAFLIPGSTGDGWEMSDEEIRHILEFDTELAKKLGTKILVGILKTDAETARQSIIDTLTWLKIGYHVGYPTVERTGIKDNEKVLEKTNICGFAVTAPKGAELSQEEISKGLIDVLELGVPIALYQLPQVTENEIAPETAAKLAEEFANFYLLKDSSGQDHIAQSGLDMNGVFLLRGAEGDYHRRLRKSGGCYDGFLLGSANCFAGHLSQIIQCINDGDFAQAQKRTDKITPIINRVFEAVANLPSGNVFSNAYKAIDQVFAYGPDALNVPPPRIYSGTTIPLEIIKITADALVQNKLMPPKGYL